jgi:hypothetical protein
MLSRFDDYPIHQTPEPVAQVATSDRNAYDRYWFNGYSDDGEFYFGVGMAIYPNLRILDCGFSIVRGGEQHAFHASRRAPKDPTETQVGPFRIEIVEPMKRLRVVIDDDTGIAVDLSSCAHRVHRGGRQTLRRDGKAMMDATRFTQMGCWQGEIRYAAETVQIDPARLRHQGPLVGHPSGRRVDPGGAPPTDLPQIFFCGAAAVQDRCTHALVFEDARGRACARRR